MSGSFCYLSGSGLRPLTQASPAGLETEYSIGRCGLGFLLGGGSSGRRWCRVGRRNLRRSILLRGQGVGFLLGHHFTRVWGGLMHLTDIGCFGSFLLGKLVGLFGSHHFARVGCRLREYVGLLRGCLRHVALLWRERVFRRLRPELRVDDVRQRTRPALTDWHRRAHGNADQVFARFAWHEGARGHWMTSFEFREVG